MSKDKIERIGFQVCIVLGIISVTLFTYGFMM